MKTYVAYGVTEWTCDKCRHSEVVTETPSSPNGRMFWDAGVAVCGHPMARKIDGEPVERCSALRDSGSQRCGPLGLWWEPGASKDLPVPKDFPDRIEVPGITDNPNIGRYPWELRSDSTDGVEIDEGFIFAAVLVLCLLAIIGSSL